MTRAFQVASSLLRQISRGASFFKRPTATNYMGRRGLRGRLNLCWIWWLLSGDGDDEDYRMARWVRIKMIIRQSSEYSQCDYYEEGQGWVVFIEEGWWRSWGKWWRRWSWQLSVLRGVRICLIWEGWWWYWRWWSRRCMWRWRWILWFSVLRVKVEWGFERDRLLRAPCPHPTQPNVQYFASKILFFLSQYSWEIMQNSAKREPYCCLTYPVCTTINNTDDAKQSTHKIHIIAILNRKKCLAAEVSSFLHQLHACKVLQGALERRDLWIRAWNWNHSRRFVESAWNFQLTRLSAWKLQHPILK